MSFYQWLERCLHIGAFPLLLFWERLTCVNKPVEGMSHMTQHHITQSTAGQWPDMWPVNSRQSVGTNCSSELSQHQLTLAQVRRTIRPRDVRALKHGCCLVPLKHFGVVCYSAKVNFDCKLDLCHAVHSTQFSSTVSFSVEFEYNQPSGLQLNTSHTSRNSDPVQVPPFRLTTESPERWSDFTQTS